MHSSYIFASTLSSTASTSSICTVLVMRGGTNRNTLPAVQFIIMPSSRQLLTISRPGMVSSAPSMSPLPRTVEISLGYFYLRANKALKKYAPVSFTFTNSFSFSNSASTAFAAAQASGLPPKVEP